MASSIGNHRRYCFLKHLQLEALDEEDQADVWDAKRKAIPGTDIDDMFPGCVQLRAAGYLATEEVQGADADELSEVGLDSSQIDAVFAALGELQ